MISPATILRRVTEKIIKRRPVIALVNNSLPFFTCSALSPPVMIWIVAISIITRETAPATPARNWRSAIVNPLVSTLRQPRAVSIAVSPQLPLGSMARTTLGWRIPFTAKAKADKCARIEVCFLPGRELVIQR